MPQQQQLKTYRIYLKDTRVVEARAHHFDIDGGRVRFYKSESEVDEDILIYIQLIAAIVPEWPDVV